MPPRKEVSSTALQSAAQAADNAAKAAADAAEASKSAAENARIAAKAASESATAIAVVATDTSWMKKSLAGIEETLKSIEQSFVTNTRFQEAVKILDNHEARIMGLETKDTRTTVMLSVGIGIISLLISLLVYHLFQGK